VQVSDAVDELEAFFDICRSIRSSASPITVDPETGICTVYRYDDVSAVLRNHEVFSNTPPGARYESQYAMLFTDPPRHRELRTLVSKAFSPRAIAQLEGRLDEIAGDLLRDVSAAGRMNVVEAISDPLPIKMIAEMLGVDPTTRQEFKRWSNSFSVVAVSQSHQADDLEEHVATLAEMFDYFDGVINDRRANPKGDLITALVQAEEEGKSLSEEELKSTCAQLLAAGDETTTNFISNSAICLARNPDVKQKVKDDPSLLPAFLEEVLRFLSPAQYTPRYARERVTLYNHVIEPGCPVFAHNGSANRDEKYFEQPDLFDISRDTSRHLTFGFGIHFCLGASLARLETRVAIGRMLRTLPGEWSVPEVLTRLADRPFFFGVAGLPLTWSGGS
jgi:cytochrome P450